MQYRSRLGRPGGGLPFTVPGRGRSDGYSKLNKPRRARCPAVVKALLVLISFFVLGFGYWLSTPIVKAIRTKRSPDHVTELFFATENGGRVRFPSLAQPATRTLSVVVPAYNEEERMQGGVPEMLTWLKARAAAGPYCPPAPVATPPLPPGRPRPSPPPCEPFTWEVIIVNDGSRDKTADAAAAYVRAEGADAVRLLSLYANGGKGAAVRKGAQRARGRYVLMADADGATRFADVEALLVAVDGVSEGGAGRGFAIGSRAHMGAAAAGGGDASAAAGAGVRRSGLRRLLMWGFHAYMDAMLGGSGGGIRDTQCGFKLFTRPAARELFGALHIERWAFDVELVFLAARVGVPMVEVPVTWHEVGGSKVNIVQDSLKMARDIIVIRACYMLGIWDSTPQPVVVVGGDREPASVWVDEAGAAGGVAAVAKKVAGAAAAGAAAASVQPAPAGAAAAAAPAGAGARVAPAVAASAAPTPATAPPPPAPASPLVPQVPAVAVAAAAEGGAGAAAAANGAVPAAAAAPAAAPPAAASEAGAAHLRGAGRAPDGA